MKLIAAALAWLVVPFAAGSAPIPIVAAENFYGDVARQIGGDRVGVISILTNPAQDPHLFEVIPSVARAVSGARIVIENGAGYDPWMDILLRAAGSANRNVIVVATLAGRKSGDNPHIWYDPATLEHMGVALANALGAIDPEHAPEYSQRRDAFARSLQPLRDGVLAVRHAYLGTQVTATEPVFAYMFTALGMKVRNVRFQAAVMNDTEPSAADVAAFQTSLRAHDVKLLVYNSQVIDPLTARMRHIAQVAGIPVVGVTETEPSGTDYQSWVLDELRAVAAALETAK